MWSFRIYDTLTGEPVLDVFPASGKWRSVFTSVGEGEHAFQLRDSETAIEKTTARDLFTPWMRTLVVLWDGVPVYAGIILKTVWSKGVLTVSHSELRLIFSKRHAFALNEFNASAQIQVVGKSMRGLVLAVVRAGSWRASPGNWTLPILFPGDEAGAVSKTWFHYQLMKVEDMLTEVSRMDGAPDFYLRPRLNGSGWLYWELVIGTPRMPGATLDLPYSVDESAVTDLAETVDAYQQLTGVFMIGAGSEQDIRVGKGGSAATLGLPYLDDSRTSKQTDVVADLDSLAVAELGTHRDPVTHYTFNLTHDEQDLFSPADVVPGARILLDVRGDEWILDGQREFYLLGVSGDMSSILTPEVQEL